MILATVYVLMSGLDGGWWARAIALASTAIVMYTRVNTVLLIGAGAALLVVIHGF
jgi:chromate transporter